MANGDVQGDITLALSALRAAGVLVGFIRGLLAQRGVSADQLWAEADAETKANHAELSKFLTEFGQPPF